MLFSYILIYSLDIDVPAGVDPQIEETIITTPIIPTPTSTSNNNVNTSTTTTTIINNNDVARLSALDTRYTTIESNIKNLSERIENLLI